mmetsp:Transcript_9983/g.14706  ORF Transcript_9983/g.14706 Transcript_9983/m.14706 type:complete len:1058 (+) Transcript_9983:44-3217(+)
MAYANERYAYNSDSVTEWKINEDDYYAYQQPLLTNFQGPQYRIVKKRRKRRRNNRKPIYVHARIPHIKPLIIEETEENLDDESLSSEEDEETELMTQDGDQHSVNLFLTLTKDALHKQYNKLEKKQAKRVKELENIARNIQKLNKYRKEVHSLEKKNQQMEQQMEHMDQSSTSSINEGTTTNNNENTTSTLENGSPSLKNAPKPIVTSPKTTPSAQQGNKRKLLIQQPYLINPPKYWAKKNKPKKVKKKVQQLPHFTNYPDSGSSEPEYYSNRYMQPLATLTIPHIPIRRKKKSKRKRMVFSEGNPNYVRPIVTHHGGMKQLSLSAAAAEKRKRAKLVRAYQKQKTKLQDLKLALQLSKKEASYYYSDVLYQKTPNDIMYDFIEEEEDMEEDDMPTPTDHHRVNATNYMNHYMLNSPKSMKKRVTQEPPEYLTIYSPTRAMKRRDSLLDIDASPGTDSESSQVYFEADDSIKYSSDHSISRVIEPPTPMAQVSTQSMTSSQLDSLSDTADVSDEDDKLTSDDEVKKSSSDTSQGSVLVDDEEEDEDGIPFANNGLSPSKNRVGVDTIHAEVNKVIDHFNENLGFLYVILKQLYHIKDNNSRMECYKFFQGLAKQHLKTKEEWKEDDKSSSSSSDSSDDQLTRKYKNLLSSLNVKLQQIVYKQRATSLNQTNQAMFNYVDLKELSKDMLLLVSHWVPNATIELLHSMNEVIMKYQDCVAQMCREDIVKEVLDILYEDMVYNRLLQNVQNSYQEDITQAMKKISALEHQRDVDIDNLNRDRLARLRAGNPYPSSHSQMNSQVESIIHAHQQKQMSHENDDDEEEEEVFDYQENQLEEDETTTDDPESPADEFRPPITDDDEEEQLDSMKMYAQRHADREPLFNRSIQDELNASLELTQREIEALESEDPTTLANKVIEESMQKSFDQVPSFHMQLHDDDDEFQEVTLDDLPTVYDDLSEDKTIVDQPEAVRQEASQNENVLRDGHDHLAGDDANLPSPTHFLFRSPVPARSPNTMMAASIDPELREKQETLLRTMSPTMASEFPDALRHLLEKYQPVVE